MASLPPIKLKPFKRGDTPSFTFVFNPPLATTNWANISVDCALTSMTAPTDNSGAAVLRLNQPLMVTTGNVASFVFQLSHNESLSLTPGTTYIIEPQLKENVSGFPMYGTPFTGSVEVVQDYIV